MKYLQEYRCKCGKLLFKGLILVSVLEIKCKRCGEVLRFKVDLPQNVFLCRDGSELPSPTSFTHDQDNGQFSGYQFLNMNGKKGKPSKNIKGSP